MEIIGKTFTEVYSQLCKELTNAPEVVSREQLTKEIIGISFQIKDPTKMFALSETRWRYLLAEILWYASGDFSTDWIGHFASFWKDLADKDGKICSNYGHQIYRNRQTFWTAYRALVADAGSRQAIAHINLPEHYFNGNRDLPCTLGLQFFIRDMKLHLITTMRSNDIWFGTTYDVPAFSIFQQTMLHFLKASSYPELSLGTYRHQAGSLHVYQKQFERVKNFDKHHLDIEQSILLKEPLIKSDGQPTQRTCDLSKALIDQTIDIRELTTILFR